MALSASRKGLAFASASAALAIGCSIADDQGIAVEAEIEASCLDFEDDAWVAPHDACTSGSPTFFAPGAPEHVEAWPDSQRDYLAGLARNSPGGFAGYWYEDGVLELGLVDPRWRHSMIATLKQDVVDAGRPALVERLDDAELCQARWSYRELLDWYHAIAADVFASARVLSSGPVERANRIEFYVDSDEAASAVEERVRQQGVPCFLVAIVRMPPGRLLCTLALHTVTISVVDGVGEPVEGVSLEIMHARTGQILDTSFSEVNEPGTYALVNSLHIPNPVSYGDALVARGFKGDLQFERRYIVRTNGCHPEQVVGEREVVLAGGGSAGGSRDDQ